MAATDITRRSDNRTENESFDYLFGRKGEAFDDLVDGAKPWNHEFDLWDPDDGEYGQAAATADETVIRHDEVSFETVGLAPGRVVLSISDEQAESILRRYGKDAPAPE